MGTPPIIADMERWDAIIVGAGPAGCAAAYDLVEAGRRVALLDRTEFPRHKACAGGLTRKTLRALRYSVAPVTREIVSAIVVEGQKGEAATLKSRNPVCAMTVRRDLDEYCLGKTRAAGAEFFRIAAIEGIEADADGVVVRTAGREFRGRFAIGADGVHSRVRQMLYGDAPTWMRRGFALEAEVRNCADGKADLIFDLAAVRQGYAWIFPKGDHLNVGLYSESSAERLDRERMLSWVRQRFGDVRAENVTGQYLGFGAENAPPPERRIFLVGDAGGFADALTGEGIYGAIASGQAAAAAIDAELKDGTPADRAFAERTAALRRDLMLSASGARWFYGNPELGYRALTAPLFRGAVINAYANGTKIAALANAVRRFAGVLPSRA